MAIPTEIWERIFDNVESDHATLWLTLLKSSSIPEQWRVAISRRKSLSFPPKPDQNYNSGRVMNLMKEFPLLRKIRLYNTNDFKWMCSEEMRKIEELSFYTETGFTGKVRGRLPEKKMLNLLENVKVLSMDELSPFVAHYCLLSLSPEAKKNLRDLKVIEITQKTLEEFPNLLSLSIRQPVKCLHLNNNPQINKLTVKNSLYLPLIEISRYIEIVMTQSRGVKIIYRGNLTINQKGISGFVSIEVARSIRKIASHPLREPSVEKEKRTYILTGELENDKTKGEFTKMIKGSNEEVKVIKDLCNDTELGYLLNRHTR